MGIISLTLPSDGQTIDAADVNTPFQTIQTVINGNLDANNLAANAVTTAKLTDGSVTPPKWANPYKFAVYRNSAANAGNGAFAKVVWDTEYFDTNNNFATGTYTAPVAGYYFFGWTVAITNSTTDVVAALTVNGASTQWGNEVFDTSTGGGGSTGSTLILLAAGNTVDVYAFSNAGAALVVGITKNVFHGHLVSIT